jgi:GMP synthase-like glutamine amidotransferase
VKVKRILIIQPRTLFLMITILQHGEYEPAGTIVDYLDFHNEPYQILRLYEGDAVPDDPPGRLIVLGGQMSVNDDREYPFLYPEKKLVREAIMRDCTVLGICLGAQLIAAACGKSVHKGMTELGWRSIEGCKGCGAPWDRLFPASFGVFQWHRETFDLPDGAKLLATGKGVPNQAFLLGHALGIQFHPEVTLPVITCWAHELGADEQGPMIEESEKKIDANRQMCSTIMDAFCIGWNG